MATRSSRSSSGAAAGSLDLPEGTVYPALHRLEEAGLLRSAWSKESGRRRRVYELTRRGQRELGVRRERVARFLPSRSRSVLA